jgi:hypothetical protein
MGMDLIGLRAASAKGKYLHYTIWCWAPLWNYVSDVCSDILTETDILYGGSNDAHRITAAKAAAMGKRLRGLLRGGEIEAHIRRVSRSDGKKCKSPALMAAQVVAKAIGGKAVGGKVKPQFSQEDLKAFADFCLASGGFEID